MRKLITAGLLAAGLALGVVASATSAQAHGGHGVPGIHFGGVPMNLSFGFVIHGGHQIHGGHHRGCKWHHHHGRKHHCGHRHVKRHHGHHGHHHHHH